MKMDDDEKRNKEKLDFFLNEKIKVHIMRKDGRFWNGTVIDKKSETLYAFLEDKFGERLLFISDIWEVDEYSEVRE